MTVSSPEAGSLQMSALRLAAVVPRGGLLDDARWERHHRLLCWLLALHLPALVVVAGWDDAGVVNVVGAWPGIWPELALLGAPALLLLLGWRLRTRRGRSLAVALGLSLCSVLLVVLTGGRTEAHLHYLVVLGFVSLYHDWQPYLTALGVVLLSHVAAAGLAGVLPGLLAAGQGGLGPRALPSPWMWAALHMVAVALVAASQVTLWQISEREQQRAQRYYAELYGSERALISRLHEAERAKRELLALASHELRTPLTGIVGSARTLDRRLEDLDTNQVRTLLSHIDLHARRLTRLVDNLVASAGSPDVDASATADVAAAVSTMVHAARGLPGSDGHAVRLRVGGDAVAMIDERALRRVVSNLLDNAFKFAEPGSEVSVTVRSEDDSVLLEVENVGPPVPEDVRRHLGQAFAQGDSSDARRAEGMGLGLHVVHSLVRPYDGRLELSEHDDKVLFRVRLHARRWVPQGDGLTTVA